MNSDLQLQELWRTQGFSQPETVLAVPGHQWLYVSNPNQPEPGFVSRISRTGEIDDLKWIDGLQRPTGMAERDGILYVTDLTRLLAFDLPTGELIDEFRSADSRSLNDVTVTRDGRLFVSDPDNGCIHIVEETTVVPWLVSDALEGPNAMLAMDDALYTGGTASENTPGPFGSLHRVGYEDKTVETIAPSEGLGTWDGLMPYAGGWVTSSPATGELWYFDDDHGFRIATVERGIADFGYDEDGTLYAPFLFTGIVAAYRLSRIPG